LHLKFARICKSKRSLPNYLFRVDHKNVEVRKLDNYLKGVRDLKKLGTIDLTPSTEFIPIYIVRRCFYVKPKHNTVSL